jgi:hypothetical protein
MAGATFQRLDLAARELVRLLRGDRVDLEFDIPGLRAGDAEVLLDGASSRVQGVEKLGSDPDAAFAWLASLEGEEMTELAGCLVDIAVLDQAGFVSPRRKLELKPAVAILGKADPAPLWAEIDRMFGPAGLGIWPFDLLAVAGGRNAQTTGGAHIPETRAD